MFPILIVICTLSNVLFIVTVLFFESYSFRVAKYFFTLVFPFYIYSERYISRTVKLKRIQGKSTSKQGYLFVRLGDNLTYCPTKFCDILIGSSERRFKELVRYVAMI